MPHSGLSAPFWNATSNDLSRKTIQFFFFFSLFVRRLLQFLVLQFRHITSHAVHAGPGKQFVPFPFAVLHSVIKSPLNPFL